MNWWPDPEELPPPLPEDKLSWTQKFCSHNWKATMLIISVVYDCTKCEAKKEEVDKWENTR